MISREYDHNNLPPECGFDASLGVSCYEQKCRLHNTWMPLPQFELEDKPRDIHFETAAPAVLAKDNIGSTVFLDDATTEELVDRLIGRGYKVTLERPSR